MVATTEATAPCSQVGDDYSRLSQLLRRAIDLIDPPRSPAVAVTGVEQNNGMADGGDGNTNINTTCTATDNDNDNVSSDDTPSNKLAAPETETTKSLLHPKLLRSHHQQQQQQQLANKKKVRFHESCALPPKIVSAADAIQAYDLLIHAASISLATSSYTSSTTIVTNGAESEYHSNMSWETLQQMADSYRALHVTSCLLIELLPLDVSSDVHASLGKLEGGCDSCPPMQQCKTSTEKGGEDYSAASSSVVVPNLSPEIVETLLSTSRKCILLLQALERKCAAKTVAQRHRHNNANVGINTVPSNKGNNNGFVLHQTTTSLFYTRGDDIHDYDRSTSDLHANYDWHDDGYLPLPFSWLTTTTFGSSSIKPTYTTAAAAEEGGTTAHNNEESYSSNNILKECLYCQQQSSDPPSSRHQRSAWTRDWIRRERIVSLRLEDYQHHDHEGGGDYFAACQDTGNELNQPAKGRSEVYNYEVKDEDMMNSAEKSGIMLDMSPKALTGEEDRLIDIMFPSKVAASSQQSITNGSNSQNKGQQQYQAAQSSTKLTRKKRAAKEREKRKQKRLRQKAARHSRHYDSGAEGSARKVDQSVHVREGFLLLVCDNDDNSNNSLVQHLGMNTNGSTKLANSVRVYAQLQPSGILSLEVCTICRRALFENNHDPVQPLPTRVRYLDFIIGAKTKCHPYMPNGSSSFHFCLEAVQFLGASLLCQSLEKDHDANEVDEPIANTSLKDMTLSFSVDEKAGGALVDGFEWVTALSGAADDTIVLEESIRLEWS